MRGAYIHSFFAQITVIACFLSALVPKVAYSASPIDEVEWNQGIVILEDDEVLNGEIYYNPLHQLVLLRSGDDQPVTTLTARQVQRFFYYNPQDNIIHRFRSIEQRVRSYPTRSFYELVAEGPVLYLRQPNPCPARPPRGVSPHVVGFRYYAYYQGKLVGARAFQRELLPVLVQESPALAHHMESEQLQPYHVGDQILLVTYFNQHQLESLIALASRR